MDDILKKLPGENESQYIFKIGQAKDSGVLSESWDELAPRMNMELGIDETDWRGSCAFRKRYRVMQQAYDDVFSKSGFGEAQINDLAEQKRELEKIKIQTQTEKLEYRKWLREEARDELIAEKICKAIAELPPLKVPELIHTTKTNRAGVLIFSDAHYGTELKISGLYGDVVNEYSPEIFESRMWDLLRQTIEICKKEGFTSISVYDLGDEIDGLLRISQLWKLRYGVIESTVRYARFITEWLNELSKYVRVKYQMVADSNHCQLRLLGQVKNTFKEENMSYIIMDKIMDRLSYNPNFEFEQNPTGYVFDNNVAGYSVLGIHGEVKNLERAVNDFARIYRSDIDVLIAGHMHHQSSTNVGIGCDIISVPSLIGVDDYSLSLNKTSDPGATFLVFESDHGNTIEYKIKL